MWALVQGLAWFMDKCWSFSFWKDHFKGFGRRGGWTFSWRWELRAFTAEIVIKTSTQAALSFESRYDRVNLSFMIQRGIQKRQIWDELKKSSNPPRIIYMMCKRKNLIGPKLNICIRCQSHYFIIYNQVHDMVVWSNPGKYQHSCCPILCQLSKWSLCLHGMVQIPEINVNNKESATLRILRSSGLKVQVPVDAGNGWLTVQPGQLSGVSSPPC